MTTPVVASPSLLAAGLLLAVPMDAARAACPIEHATYANVGDAAEVEFRPAPESATITNAFALLVGDIALDGIVQWTEDIARPYGMVTQDCPEGDVTGAEIEACTLWQGVVYASDMAGNIGLVPEEGAQAPSRLIFPDLAPALALAAAIPVDRLQEPSWDVFAIKGCQE